MGNKKGFLIVFDGLDGTGKNTQSNKLAEYFDSVGINYKKISFPTYGTPSGDLVKKYLHGEITLDDKNDIGLEKFRKSFLYVTDRCVNMTKKDETGNSILDYYNDGYVIICDRYVSSNFLFMTAETSIQDFRLYVSVMEMIEYTLCGLPRPDISLFLEMPPEKSLECIEKRKEEKDINENLTKLKSAYSSLNRYKEECKNDSSKYFINCISENGDIRSIEDIHKEIVEIFIGSIDKLY